MDIQNFYKGFSFDCYEYLGCHLQNGGAVFRTFAPNAKAISVIGSFNGWSETPMQKTLDGNFWELFVPDANPGDMYKYRISKKDGRTIDHADPFGYGMELRPKNASIIRDMSSYQFHDDAWLNTRTDCKHKPLNIYEIHLGSWKADPQNENGWYSYCELADLLIPYLKENAYNYVELMPVCEHPCDNSWGIR